MPIPARRRLFSSALCLCLALLPATAMAQPYPSKPITLIIHSAAGGSIDMINRVISERVSAILGQPIVLDFRPGGGATIGAAAVAKARPDGYTIGFLGSSIPAAQGLAATDLRILSAKARSEKMLRGALSLLLV